MRNQSQILEELAGMDDARNCEPDADHILHLADGTEHTLPTRWIVCPVCNGKGTHVNPSIDAGGLSAEDFHDDPDFAEAYLAGEYDQTCNRCTGRTTVREVDLERLAPELRKVYARQLRADAEYRAEVRAERMRGA